MKKDDKYWRFSLSSFNKSNNTGYYYYSDTSCKDKGLIKFEMDLGHKYESKDKEIEKFVKTKDHSFDFEEHSFQKYKQVLADINNKQKNEIIKNLSNYKYLKTFFKAFAITNNDKITSSIKLLSLFNEEYKNIKINYNDIDENTKNI